MSTAGRLARAVLLTLLTSFNTAFAAPVIDSWEVIRTAFYPNQEIVITNNEIEISAPIQAEDSSVVPVMITANLIKNDIKRVDIFTDANPILLTATFIPQIKTQFFQVSTRVRLDNSSFLRVIVEDFSGIKRMRAIPIKTPGGGCGGGVDPDETKLRSTAGSMKLKLFPQEKAITFNLKHPMRTGFERTSMGYYAKAWYMQSLDWQHNGAPWLKAELGPGISANPYFKINLDETLIKMSKHSFYVVARDNEGNTFTQSFMDTTAFE